MYRLKNLSRIAIPVFLFLAIACFLPNTALAQLSVSPAVVVFPDTSVGAISYQEVTISNTGSQTENLLTATADPNPPFWPTFGGTCNVNFGYAVPAGASCTFQWGFKPVHPGRTVGVGTISFESGAALGVVLVGKGTK